MAVYNVKRMSISIDSKKVAEAQNVTVRINTNGEQQHGQDGVMAISVGNLEIEASCSIIRVLNPQAGLAAMESALIEQKLVTAGMKIGEKTLMVPMVPVTGEYSSESRTGTLTGAFTLRNAGDPDFV